MIIGAIVDLVLRFAEWIAGIVESTWAIVGSAVVWTSGQLDTLVAYLEDPTLHRTIAAILWPLNLELLPAIAWSLAWLTLLYWLTRRIIAR